MTRSSPMDPRHAQEALPDWAPVEGRAAISRTFRFADFAEAFGFMTQIALHAERADHHPEWFNVYNRVDVVLTTHDAGGVTDKDLALARIMDAAFAKKTAKP